MRDVMDQLEGWWKNGEPAALATVVGTFRSAPRQPGASMLVGPGRRGRRQRVRRLRRGRGLRARRAGARATDRPVLQRYGVSDDDAFAVGLTCGGILDVFVEKVDPETYPQLGAVADAVRDGAPGGGRHGGRPGRPSGSASGWSCGRTGSTAAPARPGSTTPSATTPAACSTPGATRTADLRRRRRSAAARA